MNFVVLLIILLCNDVLGRNLKCENTQHNSIVPDDVVFALKLKDSSTVYVGKDKAEKKKSKEIYFYTVEKKDIFGLYSTYSFNLFVIRSANGSLKECDKNSVDSRCLLHNITSFSVFCFSDNNRKRFEFVNDATPSGYINESIKMVQYEFNNNYNIKRIEDNENEYFITKHKCKYERNTYRFIRTENTKKETTNPIGSNYFYEYMKCNYINGNEFNYEDNGIIFERGSGRITIDIQYEIDYVDCRIRCTNGNNNAETKITIAVIDYKPSINKYLSKIPVMVYNDKEFNSTIVISYPTVSEEEKDGFTFSKKEVTMSFKVAEEYKNKYSLYTNEDNNIKEVKNNSTFEWKDIKIKNITTITSNKDDFDKVKVVFKEDDENDYNLETSYYIQVYHDNECKIPGGKDPIGLCCDRKYEGEWCTKVQGYYSFVDNGDGNSNFRVFFEVFKQSLTNLFSGSPYWIEYNTNDDDLADYKIRFILTYIEDSEYPDNSTKHKINENNEENKVRNLANDGFNWNNVKPYPIEFANTILNLFTPSGSNHDIYKVEEEVLQELSDEIINSKMYERLLLFLQSSDLLNILNRITQLAEDNNIKKDPLNPYTPKTQIGNKVDHSEPKEEEDIWYKKYKWILVIALVVCILLIGIIMTVLCIKSRKSSKEKRKEKREKMWERNVSIDTTTTRKQEDNDDNNYYEVIMEGYLLKEGRENVIGKWQRKYFILYNQPAILKIYNSMFLSDNIRVYVDEKQSIPLECYSGIEYKKGNKEFTLILKVRDSTIKSFEPGDKKRRIHLKVESENGVEICKKWVECFRDFKNQKPKAGDAWTRPLIIDQNNGKISTTTNKAAEKKNEEIVLKAQQKRNAHQN